MNKDLRSRNVDQGFERFQRLLLALRVGDELRASEASDACGLSEDVCRTVLEGLERAGLMTHDYGDRYIRKTLSIATS